MSNLRRKCRRKESSKPRACRYAALARSTPQSAGSPCRAPDRIRLPLKHSPRSSQGGFLLQLLQLPGICPFGGWQSCLDSNQDEQSQNLLCYRYTTGLEAPADDALQRAAPPGLEPGKTESKSVVLPLHQGALRRRGANARRVPFVWQSGILWGFRQQREPSGEGPNAGSVLPRCGFPLPWMEDNRGPVGKVPTQPLGIPA